MENTTQTTAVETTTNAQVSEVKAQKAKLAKKIAFYSIILVVALIVAVIVSPRGTLNSITMAPLFLAMPIIQLVIDYFTDK